MDDNLLFDIIDLLNDGEIVYLHRQTKEILSYPDPQRWSESEYIDLIEEVKARAAAEPDQLQTAVGGKTPCPPCLRGA